MRFLNNDTFKIFVICISLYTSSASVYAAQGDVLGNVSTASVGTSVVGQESTGTGNLYFTDIGATIVGIMTPAGALVSSFSVSPNTATPLGITSDGTNLYVTDAGEQDVDIYLLDGTYVSSFPVGVQTTFPEGITYNPNTGNLYVVDGAGGNIVIEYTTAGVLVNTFPILGSSQDGIAYDAARNSYWIYDSGTDTVNQYDTSFTSIASFPGTIAAGFSGAEGLAVIGDILYLQATGSDLLVSFELNPAGPPAPIPSLNIFGLILLSLMLTMLGKRRNA